MPSAFLRDMMGSHLVSGTDRGGAAEIASRLFCEWPGRSTVFCICLASLTCLRQCVTHTCFVVSEEQGPSPEYL